MLVSFFPTLSTQCNIFILSQHTPTNPWQRGSGPRLVWPGDTQSLQHDSLHCNKWPLNMRKQMCTCTDTCISHSARDWRLVKALSLLATKQKSYTRKKLTAILLTVGCSLQLSGSYPTSCHTQHDTVAVDDGSLCVSVFTKIYIPGNIISLVLCVMVVSAIRCWGERERLSVHMWVGEGHTFKHSRWN